MGDFVGEAPAEFYQFTPRISTPTAMDNADPGAQGGEGGAFRRVFFSGRDRDASTNHRKGGAAAASVAKKN